jgi:hypothetical protein
MSDPQNATLTDWRGIEYEDGEPLYHHPWIDPVTGQEVPFLSQGLQVLSDTVVPTPCDWPDCEAQAVRHCCNAEGDQARTHHHGGIHRHGGTGRYFCGPHGRQVLEENSHLRKGVTP